MNRSKIRELAFELLYSLEIQKVEQETIEEQIENLKSIWLVIKDEEYWRGII